MKKKMSSLVGDSGFASARRVTADELRRVAAGSGASIDPNGGFKHSLVGGFDPAK